MTQMGTVQDLRSAFSDAEKVRGVFSTMENTKVGTGTTTRRVTQKMYWFVEQTGEDEYICQPINANFVPCGSKRPIKKDELLARFEPEPEVYFSSVLPSLNREMEKHIGTGDKLRKRGENFAAEYSYQNALDIDEENIRANFGIGLTYLQRGDTDKAHNIFDRLIKLENTFLPAHKHLFNEFGIQLRKQKMLDEAETYYTRAIELSSNDEHLHLNLARVCCEQEKFRDGVVHVLEAMRIAPINPAAHKFLAWLQQHRYIPQEMLPDVVATLRTAAVSTKIAAEKAERLQTDS